MSWLKLLKLQTVYLVIPTLSCSYVPKATTYSYCNQILVATNQAIEAFSGTDTGTAAPRRTVRDIAGVTAAYGIAVDTLNSEMYLTDNTGGTITVYSIDANSGSQTPIRKITGIIGVRGIAVDPFNEELYVTSSSANAVYVLSRTANGTYSPLRTVTSDGTSLRQPFAVAIDPLHGEFFVSCWQDDTIQSFPRTANGATTPDRKIGGTRTHLLNVSQLIYDLRMDQILIASEYPAIEIFNRLDNGNVKAVSEITGSNTGLTIPAGLAVDFANDQLAVVDSGNVYLFNRFDQGNVAPNTQFTHSSLIGAAHAAVYNCNDD